MAETVKAELLVNDDAQSDGIEPQTYSRVMALANKAIAFNKTLAPAYLARARTQLKANQVSEANADVALALQYEPQTPSAYFLLADIKRRIGESAQAVEGYEKFIVLTSDKARKSNGHYWIYETFMQWSTKEP